ncbi:MAG: HDOD domain-containing protein [Deltaproteobacteria bacterium]|jgi:putative nucleotidyltransferase with HDIG domain|nr:HDOD domain-containing protein [Deltaproteobacteria bacterium]
MTEKMKKRILFVDDEPMVLRGLQRTLRKMRDEWDMAFTSSAKEALASLDEKPMDVIISDMKMPQMDGTQLLAEVKRRHPHMVRLILSGHVEQEATIKSVLFAHQCLSKPCDAEVLKQTLAKLFALRDILTDDSIKKIVSQIESLPSLPAMYTEIMSEMQSADPSLVKVGDIIAGDVSMTAKILQVVNSVFFGLPQKIGKPQQAVMLLGLDAIKALVLSVKIFSEFSPKKFSWFNIDALFNHSISVSTYTKTIAKNEKVNQDFINFSLMAGLLHDIGKLILATNFNQTYRQVLTESRNSGHNLWDLEYGTFGTSHAEIGAYLMGLWNLENPIIEAVAFHHCPAKSVSSDMGLLTAVHVANALEHEDDLQSDQETELQFDTEYLAGLGVVNRIPEWRQACKEYAERNA